MCWKLADIIGVNLRLNILSGTDGAMIQIDFFTKNRVRTALRGLAVYFFVNNI
jgi:hypothetical protein